MNISDKIIQMIGEFKFSITPITKTTNLYADLGYDSLEFVQLLLEIEKVYSIQFELIEMGMCLYTNHLISLVQKKVKEAESAHD